MSENQPCVSDLVDEVERNGSDNQRLLDPGSTPEDLRSVPFAIAVPCPTRTMTRETGMALSNLAKPMFGNAVPISPDSMEVGEARNECVRIAKEMGVKWLFFVDYDVAPPANALIKLLSLNKPITAGVYHLKQVPSYPLIYVKGWPWAFEDYERGDLIKADGVGMGCTLIRMDVFDKIKPPYFKTVPGYTKGNPNFSLGYMTEDIYFCEKARAAGFDIIVDTSVQCGHVDWRNGVTYLGVDDPNGKSKKVLPGWVFRRNGEYVVETVADADHPGRKWSHTEKPESPDGPLKLDLGSGPIPHEGFTGVDAFAEGPNVLKGDIADLSWFRVDHGFAAEIRSSHSFEHLSHRDAGRVLRDWVNTLVPGGRIEIRVPDLEFHARKLLEAVDAGNDGSPEATYWIATIYGWQLGDGHVHLNGFTERRLRNLADTSGLVDIEITKQINPGSKTGEIGENGELVLTGRRPEV